MKAYLVASILICQTLACKLSLPQGLQEKEIVLNFALAYARMHLEKDQETLVEEKGMAGQSRLSRELHGMTS